MHMSGWNLYGCEVRGHGRCKGVRLGPESMANACQWIRMDRPRSIKLINGRTPASSRADQCLEGPDGRSLGMFGERIFRFIDHCMSCADLADGASPVRSCIPSNRDRMNPSSPSVQHGCLDVSNQIPVGSTGLYLSFSVAFRQSASSLAVGLINCGFICCYSNGARRRTEYALCTLHPAVCTKYGVCQLDREMD